jgi:hypothetical protein
VGRKSRLLASGVLTQLVGQLQAPTAELVLDACVTIASLAMGSAEHVAAIATEPTLVGLVQLLLAPDPRIVAACARALQNVYTRSKQPLAVPATLLDEIKKLLASSDEKSFNLACSLLESLAIHLSEANCTALILNGAVEHLLLALVQNPPLRAAASLCALREWSLSLSLGM